MSRGGKCIAPHTLAAEALAEMEHHNISALVVSNDGERVIGLVSLLALLKAGIA
jgi:CBS domain-containing protein